MTEKYERKSYGSLWGDLNESARVVREQAEAERVAREAKNRRLKEMRLARETQVAEEEPDGRLAN